MPLARNTVNWLTGVLKAMPGDWLWGMGRSPRPRHGPVPWTWGSWGDVEHHPNPHCSQGTIPWPHVIVPWLHGPTRLCLGCSWGWGDAQHRPNLTRSVGMPTAWPRGWPPIAKSWSLTNPGANPWGMPRD
jgi:hypothetical protein